MKLLRYISASSSDEINAAATANLQNVVRWSSPVVAFCPTAGTQVVVNHDLNAVPDRISIEPWIDCRWWCDQDDRAGWTQYAIAFHCSADGKLTVRAGYQRGA